MELEQLRLFLDVAREGSFDRVSEQNFTSQRTVSRQIRKLETEIGVTLFKRKSNSINLTPAGKLFVPKAEYYLRQIIKTIDQLQKVQTKQQYNLSFGFYSPYDGNIMRDEILAFKKAYPRLPFSFDVNEQSIERLLVNLTARKLDIGYVIEYGKYNFIDRQLFNFLPVCQDQMVLWMSKDNPLAQKNSISEKDLKQQILLFYSSDSTDYFIDTFRSTIKNEPNDFHIKQYYAIEETMIKCALNQGVAYVPNYLAQRFFTRIPNVVERKFASKRMNQDYTLYLVYRKDNHSRILKRFIEFVKEAGSSIYAGKRDCWWR